MPAAIDPLTTAIAARRSLERLLPDGRSTLAAVADDLAMSTRTLQRRLSDEDTSFQAVLEATRTDMARECLASGRTPAQTAALLGYADPNSFFRAFKAWTGLTPEQARTT